MKRIKLIFSMVVVGMFILSFTVIPITMNAYTATNVGPTWKCYIYPLRQGYAYEAIIVEMWQKDKTGQYIKGVSLYVNILDFHDKLERRILVKENESGLPILYPNASFNINQSVDRREIYIRAEYPTIHTGVIITMKEVTIRLEIRTARGESGIERKYYTFRLKYDDYKKILIEGAKIYMIDMLTDIITYTDTTTSTGTNTSTDTGPETYMEFEGVTFTDIITDGTDTITSTDTSTSID